MQLALHFASHIHPVPYVQDIHPAHHDSNVDDDGDGDGGFEMMAVMIEMMTGMKLRHRERKKACRDETHLEG